MSMNGCPYYKDGVKGTDSNRFVWTASFPDVVGRPGWGRLLTGRNVSGFLPSCSCARFMVMISLPFLTEPAVQLDACISTGMKKKLITNHNMKYHE